MDWVIDVIDTNETFGNDPFYSVTVGALVGKKPPRSL